MATAQTCLSASRALAQPCAFCASRIYCFAFIALIASTPVCFGAGGGAFPVGFAHESPSMALVLLRYCSGGAVAYDCFYYIMLVEVAVIFVKYS